MFQLSTSQEFNNRVQHGMTSKIIARFPYILLDIHCRIVIQLKVEINTKETFDPQTHPDFTYLD